MPRCHDSSALSGKLPSGHRPLVMAYYGCLWSKTISPHDCLRLQVDFFDASGTLFSMANFVNNFIPGGCLAFILSSKQSMMHYYVIYVSWLPACHYGSA